MICRKKYPNMDSEILDNHKRYLERVALFKSYGYDVEKERNFIVEQAKPLHGRILEAGTGKGYFALVLAQAGYKFTTFDISQEEQTFARLNLKYFGLDKQVNFRIENGECLRFKDKRFDVVFSVNTIHHLSNPYKVMDELIRVLSPEGKMVLSDFTRAGIKLMDKILSGEGRKHEVSKTTLSDIEIYLKSRGFRTEKYQTRFQDVLINYQ